MAIPVADDGRDVGDLVAAGLPLGDAPTQAGESGQEERLDVVGLEAPSLGVFESASDLFDVGFGKDLRVEGAFRNEPVEPLPHGGVDDLVEPGSDLRLIAVPNGVHEE